MAIFSYIFGKLNKIPYSKDPIKIPKLEMFFLFGL
jgi:hypothetical protein